MMPGLLSRWGHYAWAAVLIFALGTGAGMYVQRSLHGQELARQARAIEEARRAAHRAAEIASRAEAARLAAQMERDQLARELEDAAHADADADRPAIGADSVSRLRRY